MFCKARITDKTLTFQDGKIFHTTTECGGEAKLTVKHEDGESSMSICGKCLKRYIKKKVD
jgi:translation initiation factor IF-1